MKAHEVYGDFEELKPCAWVQLVSMNGGGERQAVVTGGLGKQTPSLLSAADESFQPLELGSWRSKAVTLMLAGREDEGTWGDGMQESSLSI